jgi:hypothetical protein
MSTATLGSGITVPVKPQAVRYDLFCKPHPLRNYKIDTPFSIDGQLYATDLCILITHAADGHAIEADRKVPSCDKVAWDAFDRGGWRPLEKVTHVAKEGDLYAVCEECFGRGTIGLVSKCPSCWLRDHSCSENVEKFYDLFYDDEDEFHSDDGYIVTIDNPQPDCVNGWIGGTKCARCNGNGSHEDAGTISLIGDRRWQTQYLNRIRTLGDVEVRMGDFSCDGRVEERHRGILMFRFGDDGKGFLMPFASHD